MRQCIRTYIFSCLNLCKNNKFTGTFPFLILKIPGFRFPGFKDSGFSHSGFQRFRVLKIPAFLISGFIDSGFFVFRVLKIPDFLIPAFKYSGFIYFWSKHFPFPVPGFKDSQFSSALRNLTVHTRFLAAKCFTS